MFSRVTPPDTSTTNAGRKGADKINALAYRFRSHVVEQHHARSGADRLLDLHDAVALDFNGTTGPRVVPTSYGLADPDAHEVIVFQEHEI